MKWNLKKLTQTKNIMCAERTILHLSVDGLKRYCQLAEIFSAIRHLVGLMSITKKILFLSLKPSVLFLFEYWKYSKEFKVKEHWFGIAPSFRQLPAASIYQLAGNLWKNLPVSKTLLVTQIIGDLVGWWRLAHYAVCWKSEWQQDFDQIWWQIQNKATNLYMMKFQFMHKPIS